MTVRCPNGHDSDDNDYCSVCGLAITAPSQGGATLATAAPVSSATMAIVCPACGEPRADPRARFCEVCRFDFVAGVPGPPPGGVVAGTVSVAPAATASAVADPLSSAAPPVDTSTVPAADPVPSAVPATALPTVANAGVARARAWDVVVSVDPSLDVDPDPAVPAPVGEPEYILPLDQDETLIGRRDDLRGIHPDVALRDPGASRRHASLLRGNDGSLAVIDLASANGTSVNGVELAAGARQALRDGDSITLGRWTRLTLRSHV